MVKTVQQAIICDIDGTLAIINNRSPYDTGKADQDTINVPVAAVVRHMHQTGLGYQIIYVSGREEKFRDVTMTWLARQQLPTIHTPLFMRPTGDKRKDSIVKREIFETHIKGNYDVLFVLDDRDQVVKMWREELHLPCFQVNYGDF